MSKKILISIIAGVSLIVILGGCGYYYYYYYVETVDNYVLIKYTPPQPRESIFGGLEYTDPKFEFKILEDYPDDETAIREQSEEAKQSYIWLLEEYKQEIEHPEDDDPSMHSARINAIISLLDEERILVRTTHIRKFSADEALDMIGKHWADKSLEDYAKSNKIELAIYPISKE